MNVKELRVKNHLIQFKVLGFIYDIWKCTPILSEGINFAKDYERDSYNKIIFIEKNIENKNILATFKKHSYFKKCENLKTLKIQIMFQNCFKILEFQESFTTYKWVIIYMMYWKFNFWRWLEILIIFQNEIVNLHT